jgi:hypothetical protein
MLEFPQPIEDLATGYLIKLIHEKLEISRDFELTQTVRLEFYTNDDGAFGIPVSEAIRLNPNLTEDQKARLIQTFRPVTRSSSTAGVFIDPVTLTPVLPNEAGEYPANAIPEKAAWLSVLAEVVPGEKLSDKVKALLLDSMGKMINRGRI